MPTVCGTWSQELWIRSQSLPVSSEPWDISACNFSEFSFHHLSNGDIYRIYCGGSIRSDVICVTVCNLLDTLCISIVSPDRGEEEAHTVSSLSRYFISSTLNYQEWTVHQQSSMLDLHQ